MSSPLVSIVTVCYNAFNSIESTILSVINQSYTDFEYIVIDGGSTDGTVDVIKKYIDKISYFVSEPDHGIYDAMNKGTCHASGDWINFMNAGDRFASSLVLEHLKESLNNLENCVIYGNALIKCGNKVKLQKGGMKDKGFPSLVHQCVFVRTQLMKYYHFDLQYKICADFNFLYKLYLDNKKFCYEDIDIALYDLSGVSSSHREQLYLEHCNIQGIAPSVLKIFKYKIEDFLPPQLISLLVRIKYF